MNERPTTPWNIFRAELELVAVRVGLGPQWVDENRARVVLWWNTGETIDSAADMVRAFGRGKKIADRADRDGMEHIRRAAREAREI